MTPAEAPGAATATPSPDEARGRTWWSLAFVGVPAVTAGVIAIGDADYRSPLAITALASIVPLWFTYRWAMVSKAWASPVFRVVLCGLGITAVAASPNAGTIQALIYPVLWTMAPDLRSAIVHNAMWGVGMFAAFAVAIGGTPEAIGEAAAIAGFSLVFSLAFGLWISRIAEWGEERARMLADLTSAQSDLAAAHRQDGERAERERISRELHDTLTQSLTGLVMLAQRARVLADAPQPDHSAVRTQLAMIDEVARDALSEARAVVASSSALRVDGGLERALDALASRMSRETGITVESVVSASTTRELDVIVLRCTQEALANVRKHARASRAAVSVSQDGGMLTLIVTDDGVGLDSAAIESAHGFGLAGMRDRLRLVGGNLRVEETDGGGTRLRVTVPTPTEEVSA